MSVLLPNYYPLLIHILEGMIGVMVIVVAVVWLLSRRKRPNVVAMTPLPAVPLPPPVPPQQVKRETMIQHVIIKGRVVHKIIKSGNKTMTYPR